MGLLSQHILTLCNSVCNVDRQGEQFISRAVCVSVVTEKGYTCLMYNVKNAGNAYFFIAISSCKGYP